MGFMKVIEAIKGPANVVELLDIFLRKREKQQKEIHPRTGWHPSSFCGMCPRSYVIRKLEGLKEEPLEPSLIRLFDTGHAHHYWYQNEYFGPMGILWGPWRCLKCNTVDWGFRQKDKCSKCGGKEFLYEEIPVRAKLPDCIEPVNGHADGLIQICGKWYLLEIKTINSNAFKWLNAVKEVHLKQGQIYCELVRQGHVKGVPFGVKIPMPEGILFLYISKNDTVLKDFVVPADPDIGKNEMRNAIVAERALASRKFPTRLSVCTKKSDKRAQKCEERHRCFSSISFEDLFLIGQNQ